MATHHYKSIKLDEPETLSEADEAKMRSLAIEIPELVETWYKAATAIDNSPLDDDLNETFQEAADELGQRLLDLEELTHDIDKKIIPNTRERHIQQEFEDFFGIQDSIRKYANYYNNGDLNNPHLEAIDQKVIYKVLKNNTRSNIEELIGSLQKLDGFDETEKSIKDDDDFIEVDSAGLSQKAQNVIKEFIFDAPDLIAEYKTLGDELNNTPQDPDLLDRFSSTAYELVDRLKEVDDVFVNEKLKFDVPKTVLDAHDRILITVEDVDEYGAWGGDIDKNFLRSLKILGLITDDLRKTLTDPVPTLM